MTNNTFHSHIARTRRLVAVTVSLVALGGFGAVAAQSAGPAGATTEPACFGVSTPTPSLPMLPVACTTPTASPK